MLYVSGVKLPISITRHYCAEFFFMFSSPYLSCSWLLHLSSVRLLGGLLLNISLIIRPGDYLCTLIPVLSFEEVREESQKTDHIRITCILALPY